MRYSQTAPTKSDLQAIRALGKSLNLSSPLRVRKNAGSLRYSATVKCLDISTGEAIALLEGLSALGFDSGVPGGKFDLAHTIAQTKTHGFTTVNLQVSRWVRG